MPPLKKSLKLASVPLSLVLAGCESWSEIQTQLPSKALSELTKPVPVYSKAPCWMQKAWSEDNSRKKTAETGKVTVYSPPCVTDKKPPENKPAEPKTS